MTTQPKIEPEIVSRAEWTAARTRLLADEKALTHARERLAEQRRALPWVQVTEPYVFERGRGKATLADLFDGRSQLVVYHFMFGPDATTPCRGCSFWADNFNGIVEHLAQRDVSFVAVSRAPLARLTTFARRMGWRFEWVSSRDDAFNRDHGVYYTPDDLAAGPAPHNYGSEQVRATDKPGISVFFRRPDGAVFHTYSCYARGLDMMNTAYQYLDLVPRGRDEAAGPMAWLKLRDEYVG